MSDISDFRNALAKIIENVSGAAADTRRAKKQADDGVEHAIENGSTTVATGLNQVSELVSTIQRQLTGARTDLEAAMRSVATAPDGPSPDEVISYLEPALETLKSVLSSTGRAGRTRDEAEPAAARTLKGAQGGPLQSRLAAISESLETLTRSCIDAIGKAENAVKRARDIGRPGE